MTGPAPRIELKLMRCIAALAAILFVTGSGLGLKVDELVNEARLMVLDPAAAMRVTFSLDLLQFRAA